MAERTRDQRAHIVRVAADLLRRGGREAVSTRAVSAAAGVQAPTLYRQFGDMAGLLDAAAREVLASYVRQKAAREPGEDPVDDLRHGWDTHVAFGLANPAAYQLLYSRPSPGDDPAVRDGHAVLHGLVARVAEAGRLRVSVPHAVHLIQAGGNGVTLTLLASPPDQRDPRLSAAMREAVLAAITTAAAPPAPAAGRAAAHAVALRAVLGESRGALSAAERLLLGEWLDRLASAPPGR